MYSLKWLIRHYPMTMGALIALVIVIILIATTGCTPEENKPVAADTVPSTETVSPEATAAPASTTPPVFTVGQAVSLGEWTVTAHGVTDNFESMFKPAEGNRFVLVDVEVGYTGEGPQPVSSLLCFELQDSENRAHPISAQGNPIGSMDGEITPGGARRGGLVYEVPASATGLRLNFKCDLMTRGSATIQLGI